MKVWDVFRGHLVHSLCGHSGPVMDVAFLPMQYEGNQYVVHPWGGPQAHAHRTSTRIVIRLETCFIVHKKHIKLGTNLG